MTGKEKDIVLLGKRRRSACCLPGSKPRAACAQVSDNNTRRQTPFKQCKKKERAKLHTCGLLCDGNQWQGVLM